MRFVSIFRDKRLAHACRGGALALSVVAVTVGLPAQESAPSATYRARTDLVVLQVAVTDARHQYVSGLRVEDFTVYEDGVRQEIAVFASATAPLDVMLLIDTSGSMLGRLDVAKRAAIDLLASLNEGDRAGLILFNTYAEFAHPITEDLGKVAAAIRGASADGATALYEAVYVALSALAHAQPPDGGIRRQALVVLSDGADNFSHIPFQYALQSARASDVTIFTILLGSPLPGNPLATNAPWRDATVRFEMRRLAEDTGGRLFTASAAEELSHVYHQIGKELREQYWLAYAATNRPGFRRVSVRVTRPPGLQARTRTGYDASSRVTASSRMRRPTP